jgi:hypothetical protein
MAKGSHRAKLFLRMAPMWSRVDEVRRLVESFCASARAGAAREEQLALAAHELVQNAIANGDGSELDLEVEVDRSAGRARLAVTNAISPERVEALRARVARVQGEEDPLAGYLEAMRVDPEAPGGLGLSRIRYEGQLELGVELHGDRVTVRAEGPLAQAPVP